MTSVLHLIEICHAALRLQGRNNKHCCLYTEKLASSLTAYGDISLAITATIHMFVYMSVHPILMNVTTQALTLCQY